MRISQSNFEWSPHWPNLGTLRGAVANVIGSIADAGRDGSIVRELLQLTDDQLDDIGLERGEILSVARGGETLDELAARWSQRRAGHLDRWESRLIGKRRSVRSTRDREPQSRLIA